MNRRGPRPALLRVAALLAALALGAAPTAADDANSAVAATERAVARFLAAYRAGDTPAMKAVVAASMIGPHGLAEHLFAEHARATLAEPPRTTDFLDAAAALADGVAADLDARGLSAVVAAWRELDREALARNLRLRALWGELPSERDPARAAEVVERVQEVEADIAAGHGLVLPIYLRGRQGMALKTLGRFDEAIAAWRDGATLAESVRWPNRKVVFLRAIGTVEVRRDRHAAAVAPYTEALELLESFGSSASAKTLADTRTELAVCLVESGRSADALPVAEQALREQTALGNHAGMARVLLKLGAIRRAFLQMDQALELLERGTAEYEAAGNGGGAAYGRSLTATVLFDLSQFDRAGTVFRRARDEAEALGLEGVALDAALGLGKVLREQGRFEEAQALHRGVIERSGAGRNILAPRAWKELARDLTAAGDHDGALEAHERAVALQESLGGTKSLLRVSYRELAEAYLAVGRPAEAIGAARKSVAGWRQRVRRHGEEVGPPDSQGLRLAADVGAFAALDLALADANAGDAALAEAFHFAESSRAALLADALLAAREPPVESVAVKRARDLVETTRKRVLLLAFGGDAGADVVADAKRTHGEATRRLRDLLGRADLERRADPPRATAEPVSVEEAQAALPAKTLLVVYHQSATRAFAVALGRDQRRLIDLGDPRRYAAAAKAWREALTSPDGNEGAHAETLYEALLQPLEPLLPEGGTLLVGADGHLANVPFEAMVRRRGEERRRAIERWTMSYVPSATVHTLIERERAARPPGDALVALGDPVYPTEALPIDRDHVVAHLRGLTNLERLPASGEEVREVAALFPEDRRTVLLRAEATRARLAAALAAAPERLRALHLACHGYADPTDATRGGLVLSDLDVLTVDDVARLRVSADLVVLSACESGVGTLRRGEGILGFARAFLAAGASRVLVADRRVADEDARVLVRDFYRRHLVDGLPPAAALRAAKLARLAAGGAAAHPYAWSALVLWE